MFFSEITTPAETKEATWERRSSASSRPDARRFCRSRSVASDGQGRSPTATSAAAQPTSVVASSCMSAVSFAGIRPPPEEEEEEEEVEEEEEEESGSRLTSSRGNIERPSLRAMGGSGALAMRKQAPKCSRCVRTTRPARAGTAAFRNSCRSLQPRQESAAPLVQPTTLARVLPSVISTTMTATKAPKPGSATFPAVAGEKVSTDMSATARPVRSAHSHRGRNAGLGRSRRRFRRRGCVVMVSACCSY